MGNVLGRCYNLEEIVFQEGLENIVYLCATSSVVGEQEGEGNKVKSIYIPSSVKVLQDNAFALFVSLENVTIGEGSQLETLGEGAFYRCYALKSIVLPETVTSIGDIAFADCYALETVDMEKTAIKDIPFECFTNNYELKNLKLPAELVSIGEMAFFKAGIEELFIPETVETIGDAAFKYCTSMKTLEFSPDNKMEILGSLTDVTGIFSGATNLETLILSNHLETIGTRVFEECGVKVVKMANEEEPSQLKEIGDYAFAQCQNLVSFDHFENVIEIGNYAFINCNIQADGEAFMADLDGLNYMGAMAFGFNTNLPVGYIPASLNSLGGNPYAGLDKSKLLVGAGNEIVELVTDDNGVVSIMDYDTVTIYGVYGLTGEYLMDSDFYVYKEGALAGNDFTKVTVSDELLTVPGAMFMNCKSLVSVELGDKFTSIGDYAFYGSAIETIAIPAGVTTIGNYAFADCDALNNVVIPAATTTMGRYCFAYSDALSDFTFEESTVVQQLGDHFFFNCVSLTEVVVPSKPRISYDESYEFENSSYYSGALPSYMFAGTGIVNAVIPKQVTYYYTDGVFADCKNLIAITFETDCATTSNSLYQPMNKTFFKGCDNFTYTAYVNSITNGNIGFVRYIHRWGITDLRFNCSVKDEGTAALPNYPALQYTKSTLNLHFDQDTYTDIIEYFSTMNRGWGCNVFDKDGNQLFGDSLGHIVMVKDARGNVIWQAE